MTNVELFNAVQNETGRTDITQPSIDHYINFVLRNITRRHPFLRSSLYFTYTIGQFQYDVATIMGKTNYRKIEGIGDTNGLPLELILDYDKWIWRYTNGQISGEPQEYIVQTADVLTGLAQTGIKQQVWVNPTPNLAYTHLFFYSYVHPDYVSGAPILLDNNFWDCIFSGVCWRALRSRGQGQTTGKEYYMAYEEELAELAMNLIPPKSSTSDYHDF